MNLKVGSLAALLTVSVAIGGTVPITPASAHTLGKHRHPYGCDRNPKPNKCHRHRSGAGTTGGAGGGNGSAGGKGTGTAPGQTPRTGYGGTAQDRGASARTGAAGGQAVVVGLTSASSSQQVVALPATGGGAPPAPLSPLPTLFACSIAVLGLGLRKAANRL